MSPQKKTKSVNIYEAIDKKIKTLIALQNSKVGERTYRNVTHFLEESITEYLEAYGHKKQPCSEIYMSQVS